MFYSQFLLKKTTAIERIRNLGICTPKSQYKVGPESSLFLIKGIDVIGDF